MKRGPMIDHNKEVEQVLARIDMVELFTLQHATVTHPLYNLLCVLSLYPPRHSLIET